jgi:effector-binding domain-containing protein
MPLEEIGAVIATSNIATRNELIAGHLDRLETSLARTQDAAASLRDLLQPSGPASAAIEHRSIEPTPAVAIRDVIDLDDVSPWYQGAFGELYATLAAQRLVPDGPGGGVYANDLFAYERGEATVFIPCTSSVRSTGRVESLVVPGVELALIEYAGADTDIDRAYGALATYVTDHALAVEGPIREYYIVGRHDSPDEALWRTEIGWPIFTVATTQ